jgi:hypothetical protein
MGLFLCPVHIPRESYFKITIARNPAYVNWIAVLDDNSKSDSGE